MLNSREEFECGIIEFILIALPIISGIFFIVQFYFLNSSFEYASLLRSLRFPLMAINAAFWLHFMTPKVSNLPKRSELQLVNNALTSEVKIRTVMEEKLLMLNANLDKAIKEKTSELQAIIDNSPLAMIQVNRACKVLFWNRAAEKLFGWQASEVLGKTLPTIASDAQKELSANLYKTIVERKSFHAEVKRLHKSGKVIDVCIWNAPVVAGDEKNVAMAMFADNTERAKLIEDLQDAKEAALVANQTKSDFLARVSHEIRTPLNAIIGFSEILTSECVDEREKNIYLNTINKNGQFLSILINDILDFSKIEAGKIKFESKDINLIEMIRDIMDTARIHIMGKPVQLILEPLPFELPKFIRTDPLRFRQVLLNIICNSIKFTAEGSVRIVVQYSQPTCKDSYGLLQVCVKDTGIGMSDTQTKHLFKPYYQADLNTTRKFGGTGLGLSIAKHLAKLMGGDVQLEHTVVGIGTDFLVTIETVAVDEVKFIQNKEMLSLVPNIQDDPDLLRGKKVLIVDDSKDNLVLVSRIISKMGGRVETAEDGLQGVEKVSHNFYDVVLMDLEMPRMDGIQALQKIRSLGINTHVIALTGHAYEDDRVRCLEAGFDDHVCKPINKATLIQSVLKNLSMDLQPAIVTANFQLN